MTCTECGAAAKEGSGRFCSHCGAALPDADRISAYEYMTHADRFAKVRSHVRFDELMKHSPAFPAKLAFVPGIVIIVFGVVFFAFGFSMWSPDFPGAPIKIFMSLFCALFIGIGIATLVRAKKLVDAPMKRRVAVIVDERTKVTGSDDSTSTTYFATVQFEDGTRQEMKTSGVVAGGATRGDIGVIYTKLDKLVSFERVDVGA